MRLRYFASVLLSGLLLFGSTAVANAQASPPLIHLPRFTGSVDLAQGAIFWLGSVGVDGNYADVRIGQNDQRVSLSLHVFDRDLRYQQPGADGWRNWDAVTVYLDTGNGPGEAITTSSYRFETVLSEAWLPRKDFQRSSRGQAGAWVTGNVPVTTTAGIQGSMNNNVDDRGWTMVIQIPFASLGLPASPGPGQTWRMALELHDKDGTATLQPVRLWPSAANLNRPNTWGIMAFGPAETGAVPNMPSGRATLRHGVGGVVAPDAHVGGSSVCGDQTPDYFRDWGSANYAGVAQINIQNEWDISDWPCFSKYYVTFPLNKVPTGVQVVSATLTVNLFGNAGYRAGDAKPSWVQAATVAGAWAENSITWNNAPPVAETISGTWVKPVDFYAEFPGVPYTWDVTKAVATAKATNQPLRLALYSTDAAYHSGKYFWSADAGEPARPRLDVVWGEDLSNPGFKLDGAPKFQQLTSGQSSTFTVDLDWTGGFDAPVTLTATSSAPEISLQPQTITLTAEGTAQFTLRDIGSSSAGSIVPITITGEGGGKSQFITIAVLRNGSLIWLPALAR
ncbi:MAG: DNRLRE domain-containing protein [Anaerolineales bacterium]|nr:DNRLRE domain-containing protein [Anaerolineales bacterium]